MPTAKTTRKTRTEPNQATNRMVTAAELYLLEVVAAELYPAVVPAGLVGHLVVVALEVVEEGVM
jgi:hypothetical protein